MEATTEKEAAAMPERENTCCFTGHREYKLPWGSDENDPPLPQAAAAAL